jgi:hypothetical protein
MDMRSTRALAPRLWALAALIAINPTWVLSEAVAASAAPLSQEETVYRPVCPDDELSGGWASCRLTIRDGAAAGAVRPGDGGSHARHD